MKTEKRRLEELKPLKRNVRHHSEQQIREMVRAVKEFGQTRPMVVDENGNILVGNCLYEALKEMKRKDGDVLVVSGLSDKEKKKLILSDNKLYRLGMDNYDAINEFIKDIASDGDFSIPGFDEDIVKRLTQEIADDADECVSSLQSDYNATVMGVPRGDVDFTDLGQIFEVDGDEDTQEHSDVKEDDFDEETETNEHGVKQGDIWQLGRHRLMCGDATRGGDVLQLTNKEDIDIVLTDPPYGNGVSGKYGRGQLGIRTILGDEDLTVFKKFIEVMPCSKIIYFLQWRTLTESFESMRNRELKINTVGVWDKKNAGLNGGGGISEQWEAIIFAGDLKYKKFGGNVFNISREQHKREDSPHPHQKPLKLLNEILEFIDGSDRILDVFGGSGSTLIACEQTNRQCYMMELDPHYCDVIISRWEKLTGQKALKLNV